MLLLSLSLAGRTKNRESVYVSVCAGPQGGRKSEKVHSGVKRAAKVCVCVLKEAVSLYEWDGSGELCMRVYLCVCVRCPF